MEPIIHSDEGRNNAIIFEMCAWNKFTSVSLYLSLALSLYLGDKFYVLNSIFFL